MRSRPESIVVGDFATGMRSVRGPREFEQDTTDVHAAVRLAA
jgi:hypothetical protein